MMDHQTNKMLQKGLHYQAQGKFRDALTLFRKIVAKDACNVTALYQCGVILHQLGRKEDSIKTLIKTVDLAKDFPEAHLSLALLWMEFEQFDKAQHHFQTAIALNPNMERAHYRLGQILFYQRDFIRAVDHFKRSLSLCPNDDQIRFFLGSTLYGLGRFSEALPYLRQILRNDPNPSSPLLRLLGNCLAKIKFTNVGERVVEDICLVLGSGEVEPSDLSLTILSILHQDPNIMALLEMTQDEGQTKNRLQNALQGGAALPGIDHPLLLAFLASDFIPDAEFHTAFTRLRRQFLLCATDHLATLESDTHVAWLSALAQQCFINEYLFAENAAEREALTYLETILQHSLAENFFSPGLVALIGSYRPLYTLAYAQQIARIEGPPSIKKLIDLQIIDPLKEQQLRKTISLLTPIDNPISQAVRNQYEENPYPRWVTTATASEHAISLVLVLKDMFPYWNNTKTLETEKLDFLIAGCGTGRHAIHVAKRYKEAQVLAVDLSLVSLGYAQRMTQRLGINTVTYKQADILHLGGIQDRFHVIESVGVLHHIGDPVMAWQILVNLLRPGGVMKIGLYSERARQHIILIREFIKKHGFLSDLQGIRQCRDVIMALPSQSPIRKVVLDREFYCASTCRDLIFHIQEQTFTLPKIQTILNQLGLSLLGFEFDDPRIMIHYKQAFPDDPHQTSLINWHRFEQDNPDTFLNMYQFWVEKPTVHNV